MRGMKPEHQAKIHELVESLAAMIKVEAEKLYRSGGVDVDAFSVDDYRLAKIVVTAAAHACADQYRPFNTEDRAIVRNLGHFQGGA